MKKINTNDLEETPFKSPKGKFEYAYKELSVALGRDPESTDLEKRHPFDVALCRIPPGRKNFPYHAHSAQWEFYHVISGCGTVRDEAGETKIETGDAFVFKPGEPHQIINDSEADLTFYIIADNPLGEHCWYPDSKKWFVSLPECSLIASDPLDYFESEE